ncbi:ABC transporter ATP-binding protein [Pseudaeromonas paramecii]|uniref:ABC transporter ATP-binding protein n=1 Tax=Pseudaeromonas paramecii TaxID=2138166 RepID=A0ABP8PZF1_9GAMM
MSETPLVELTEASRRFVLGGQTVMGLDRVDLRIRQGEYLAVMGPSGSGKSTLLNLLGLLDRPDSGSYRLDGQLINPLGEQTLARLRAEKIGFVFQSFHLIPRLSAAENLALPLVLAGWSPKARAARCASLLDQLNLSERAHHLPHQLSGGQRQRVAIGRALALSPPLLLADEPTGNLDSQSGQEVMHLLESLHQQAGITLILVTHDGALGARAARQLRMADGRLVSDSGAAEGAVPRGEAPCA